MADNLRPILVEVREGPRSLISVDQRIKRILNPMV
jgi:hypothetical protein